jgi:hypothetical protein
MPRSVALDDAALAAAERVGESVGEQLGRAFDEVQFRGEPGLCPLCHLSMIIVRGGGEIECATCGAGGHLEIGDGSVQYIFDRPQRSVVTMDEKRAHFAEVQETAARQRARSDEIEQRAASHLGAVPRLSP